MFLVCHCWRIKLINRKSVKSHTPKQPGLVHHVVTWMLILVEPRGKASRVCCMLPGMQTARTSHQAMFLVSSEEYWVNLRNRKTLTSTTKGVLHYSSWGIQCGYFIIVSLLPAFNAFLKKMFTTHLKLVLIYANYRFQCSR